MNKYRVAVIGCGVIAGNHLPVLQKCENAVLTALCDIRSERAEKRREEFCENARIYTDWLEMLDTEKPNVVHILTPHYLHFKMTMEALSRNMHVVLEKPACLSSEEAAALLAAEKRSRGRVTVCFQNRMNAAMQEMRRRVLLYGGVKGGRAMVSWRRDASYYSDDWHGKRATEGGGVLMNQAIHTLDLLLWYCGKPASVSGSVANRHLKGVVEVEDSADLIIRFESGAVGHFAATTAYATDSSNFLEVLAEGHQLHLYGNRLYDNGEQVFVREDAQSICYGKRCYGNGHEVLLLSFYTALENGGEPPVSLESALWSTRVLEACYTSDNEEIQIK